MWGRSALDGMRDFSTFSDIRPSELTVTAGFRFGDRGTQTSRTIMLNELTALFDAVPAHADPTEYTAAIVDDNALDKQTSANRRLTGQRLRELYGLDPRLPLFRVLRRLWAIDELGRPLLAILCSLARDPLLRSTAAHVLGLPIGAALVRTSFLEAILGNVGNRLNESIVDKVARNAASSWSQSGHLQGRVRKVRRDVTPTVGPVAMALWMGSLEGLAGERLLRCRWAQVLDRSQGGLVEIVFQAKQVGLLSARIGGGVIEIDTSSLDRLPQEY